MRTQLFTACCVLSFANYALAANRTQRLHPHDAEVLRLSEFTGERGAASPDDDSEITTAIKSDGPTLSIRVKRKDALSNYCYDLHVSVAGRADQRFEVRNGRSITRHDIRLADLNGDGYLDIMIVGGTDHRGKEWYKTLIYHDANQEYCWLANDASQHAAVTAIKRLGGSVTFDTKSPDRPVTGVRLFGPQFTDAHLVHLKGLASLETLSLYLPRVTDAGLVHLKGLASLQVLNLSATQVTDAGLVQLRGLTNLTRLDLAYTKITDAGLVHVEGLTNLTTLGLGYTGITDTGLESLTALRNLRTLYLTNTEVTGAGVKALRTVLPQFNTDIAG
jgi:hypothetical protein